MPEVSPSRYMVQAGWGDVPHLDEKTKTDLLASTPPHLRKARSEGSPSMGQGSIYPIDPEEITVTPFRIPDYWWRGYGLDVGWNKTAAIWLAHDRDNDVLYAHAEHYRGEVEVPIHAAAIKARGVWIPGLIDPAARGRSQVDGRKLIDQYRDQSLNLLLAQNAVEAGLQEVLTRLSTGRLKFFSTMQNLLAEYRLYHRDERCNIVKKFDHALDALRYGVMGVGQFRLRPVAQTGGSGRGRDSLIGY